MKQKINVQQKEKSDQDKREKAQITRFRNEKGSITMDSTGFGFRYRNISTVLSQYIRKYT